MKTCSRATILLANVHGGTVSTAIPSVLSCSISIASASCLHLRHQPLAESSATVGVRSISQFWFALVDCFPGSLPTIRQMEQPRVLAHMRRIQSPKGKLPVGRRPPNSPIHLYRVPERQQIRRTASCMRHRCDTHIHDMCNTPRRCEHSILM